MLRGVGSVLDCGLAIVADLLSRNLVTIDQFTRGSKHGIVHEVCAPAACILALRGLDPLPFWLCVSTFCTVACCTWCAKPSLWHGMDYCSQAGSYSG